jgi:glycosyltransferase involved in cell wall biosynthesis
MAVQRKKVLIISHTYAASVNRMKFIHMAKDKRFDLLLVTPRKWQNNITVADNSDESGDAGYRTKYVDVCFGGHPVTYLIPGLATIIREYRPDLIYCEQEPVCLVSLQTALLSGIVPIIYFTWENIDRRDWRYLLFWPVRMLCLQKSKFMAAGSREAASVIRRHGYKKDIYVTPILGVSEELFFPKRDPALKSKIAANSCIIGYVGRFVDQKGVMTLIEAVNGLGRQIDWHLVLVGDGPQKEYYESTVRRLGIESRVTILPSVAHDEVPQFINCLDVLVLPSKSTARWKEQFGHVLIEAMACGVPVIGSSSGEIPNVIADAGLVFREGDATCLKEKLTMLVADAELRNSLIQKGVLRVNERYTDTKIAANMIALYEIALNMERNTVNTLTVG